MMPYPDFTCIDGIDNLCGPLAAPCAVGRHTAISQRVVPVDYVAAMAEATARAGG